MILGKVLCRSMIIGNTYWLLSILRRRISMAFSLFLLHLTCPARRRRFLLLVIKLFLVTVILIVLLLILAHSLNSFILANNYHLTLVVVLVIKSVGAVAVIKFAMEAAAAVFPSLAAVVAIKVLLLSFLLLHNSPPLHFSNSSLVL